MVGKHIQRCKAYDSHRGSPWNESVLSPKPMLHVISEYKLLEINQNCNTIKKIIELDFSYNYVNLILPKIVVLENCLPTPVQSYKTSARKLCSFHILVHCV